MKLFLLLCLCSLTLCQAGFWDYVPTTLLRSKPFHLKASKNNNGGRIAVVVNHPNHVKGDIEVTFYKFNQDNRYDTPLYGPVPLNNTADNVALTTSVNADFKVNDIAGTSLSEIVLDFKHDSILNYKEYQIV